MRLVLPLLALLLVACAPAAAPTPAPAKPTEAAKPAATPIPAKPTEAPAAKPAEKPVATASPKPAAQPAAKASPAAKPEAKPTDVAAGLIPCSAGTQISAIQTPLPTTAKPAAEKPADKAPAKAPAPTPTLRPAPQQDRVGFPENYEQTYKLFYVYDRLDNNQIRYICANDVATTVKPGQAFPHGSILVFESWSAKRDASANAVKDGYGHLIRETLSTIFVMRKEQGFGTDYQNLRTGEWEYVAYRPDKSHQTPPQGSANCAACHLGAGQDRDWVFRPDLFFTRDRYGQTPQPEANEVVMNSMAFFPRTLSVTTGTTIKWTNRDVTLHTATVPPTSGGARFDTGVIAIGANGSHTFNEPGTFEYICTLHPDQMRATVQVTS